MRFLGRRSSHLLAAVAPLLAGSFVVTACRSGETVVAEAPRVSVIPTTLLGSPASPSPKEPPAPLQTYLVEPGDTIAGLANRFGITAAEIARASRLNDPNRLSVGQKLSIPPPTTTTTTTTAAPTTTASTNPTTASITTTTSTTTTSITPTTQSYVVREGDTLGSIADKFDVTASAIAAASHLVDVNRLAVGQKLTIPLPTAATSR